MLKGILPVYKEKGYTSFDVVAKLRGILKTRKIGHTGTLDPDAEGVLPVCVGAATKLVELLTDHPKEYEAKMLFGIATDTQDVSGNIIKTGFLSCSSEEVKETILSFSGSYDQMPPMYSALKVGGKKLYELAREGKTVERKTRRVIVYSIDILNTDLSAEEPAAYIRVRCSKGTYIRTLINDIGEMLGCGACMKSLLRTEAAGFALNDCMRLDEIERRVNDSGAESLLISPESVFKEYPGVNVTSEADILLCNGNALVKGSFTEDPPAEGLVRVYYSNGDFKAVYESYEDYYKVRYMF